MKEIFLFIIVMWLLIIGGGELLIAVTSQISIDGYLTLGSSQLYYASMVKAVVAIVLVIGWIYVLIKIKNWIFNKQIKN